MFKSSHQQAYQTSGLQILDAGVIWEYKVEVLFCLGVQGCVVLGLIASPPSGQFFQSVGIYIKGGVGLD